MSPILTDGQRPVGGAWPAGEKLRFKSKGKERFVAGGAYRPVVGNYFARRVRLRQANTVPTRMQTRTPKVSMLFTVE
jgi:hypothetical protein